MKEHQERAAGVVVAKGEKVTHVKVGDHVATVAGGAFAEYVLVEARMAMREMALIPEGVPLEVAALTEPFACAYHGFVESEIRVGDEVAVLGCGAIGLMFIRLAKMGGARVIATDVNARRLQFARQVGADVVINSGEAVDPAKAVRDQTEGRGVDVAIEAVGLPSTWEQAFGMVRAGGLVTFFGGCEKGTSITLDTQRIHYDEIRMQGVYNYHHPDHFHKAFQLIRQGALDPAVFVTDHASLAETGKVFERLLQGYDGIKFAIHPK